MRYGSGTDAAATGGRAGARISAYPALRLPGERAANRSGDAVVLPSGGVVGVVAHPAGARVVLRRCGRGNMRRRALLCARSYPPGEPAPPPPAPPASLTPP